MSTIKIQFDGLDEMLKEFERQEKSLVPATEKALKATFEAVQPGIESTMPPHKRSGKTAESLIKEPIVGWSGNTATVRVGFKIRDGGLASQFLIYGAKASATGVPYRAPDMKLWNAVFGSSVKKKVEKIQKEVFEKELFK